MIAKMISDHDNVRAIAARLKALLALDAPSDMQLLASARWALASALMQLFAAKERYIYAKLEQHERSDVRHYFERSKADLLRRFTAYTTHMRKWPTSGTQTDWPEYRKSAVNAVDLYLERLKMEETELFPYLERIELDLCRPAMTVSNWTREAFAVQQHIDR